MARSPDNNALAFPAEVARYLCVEAREIPEMIRLDALPAISFAKKKRKVFRIPLRDLHTWLKNRSKNDAAQFANYDNFLADFNLTARNDPDFAALQK